VTAKSNKKSLLFASLLVVMCAVAACEFVAVTTNPTGPWECNAGKPGAYVKIMLDVQGDGTALFSIARFANGGRNAFAAPAPAPASSKPPKGKTAHGPQADGNPPVGAVKSGEQMLRLTWRRTGTSVEFDKPDTSEAYATGTVGLRGGMDLQLSDGTFAGKLTRIPN
jgi:hypothetical protein